MSSSKIAAPLALMGSLALSLAVAGCDNPKSRPAPPPAETAAAPAAAPTAPPPGDPMPALPAWSAAMVGKTVKSLSPTEPKLCTGNTDNVQARYGGAAPGVQIVGWGWDPATKAPIGKVLLADVDGVVVGAGETGLPRPDVNKVKPEITSPTTGWAAYTSKTAGPIVSYGLIGGGKALCVMGRVEF